MVDNTQYTRMKYTIRGDRGDGTVYLEMKKPQGGSVACRYMFADVQGEGGLALGVELQVGVGVCRSRGDMDGC